MFGHDIKGAFGDAEISAEPPEIDLSLGRNPGNNDKEDIFERRHAADNSAQFFSVYPRHDHVAIYDVRDIGLQDIEGGQAVFRCFDLMPLPFKQVCHILQHDRVIINDQNSFHISISFRLLFEGHSKGPQIFRRQQPSLSLPPEPFA